MQHLHSSTSTIRCCSCSCIDYALLCLRILLDIPPWVLFYWFFSFSAISYFSLLINLLYFHPISSLFYSFSHNNCTRSNCHKPFTAVLEKGLSRIWKYPFQHFKQYTVENKLPMYVGILHQHCGNSNTAVKSQHKQQRESINPSPTRYLGHSFTHFWMYSRLWTDRVAKFFCQMCWKQKIVWQSNTKKYQPPSKSVIRGFQKWPEHQGNRQTHSCCTTPLEEGCQLKWHSTLWMFSGGEGCSFILNESWLPWTSWVRKKNAV